LINVARLNGESSTRAPPVRRRGFVLSALARGGCFFLLSLDSGNRTRLLEGRSALKIRFAAIDLITRFKLGAA